MLNLLDEIDKNSLLYWFPKVKDLGIPVPETRIIEIPRKKLAKILDGDASEVKEYVPLIQKAIKELGGPPVFVRTDHTSAKHYYTSTCFLEKDDEQTILKHVYRLVEFSEMAGIIGLPYDAIVVREFLELDHAFRAFDDLPVARERRYFVKDGKVQCHHPYWPEEAIVFRRGSTPPENWKEMLRKLNEETEEEVSLLSEYAARVARAVEGYWSVDFAMTKDGKWYLIDMALGEVSWHPEDCRYAAK